MRNLKQFSLSDAIASIPTEQGSALSFAELAHAHALAVCDGTDLRLRKWVSAFGALSAWELSSEQIEVASEAMFENGYSPSSINRDIGTIGSVYKWAKLKRLCPRGFKSPTLGVRRYEEQMRRVYLEQAQLDALRARALAVPDRRFGVFVALAIETGARKSELLERRWSEVDLSSREILAPVTKNGNPRILFFSEQTADLIRRVYPKRAPEALLFEGRVPGQPIDYKRIWGVITKELGLDDLHIHDIRHVASANLLRAGVIPRGAGVQSPGGAISHGESRTRRTFAKLDDDLETCRSPRGQAWCFG